MTHFKNAAVIGAGVIGSGWIARLIENGINVSVFDPAPDTRDRIERTLVNSRAAYGKLISGVRCEEGSIAFTTSISHAVENTDFVIESVPERLDIKQSVFAEIEQTTGQQVIIASSTSGIMPTDLQAKMHYPERLLVAHPFNPVYLIPLVELVGGKLTSKRTLVDFAEIIKETGMHPLIIKKEIAAFVADRLLEALWRESLWLVKDGVATTGDIDDAIRFGFGLRFAQMGIFDTYRIAGGRAGMSHFLSQFGPSLQWPWSKLTDVPELDAELVALITKQSDEQSNHMTIAELEQKRDDNLIGILQALQQNQWGAGKTLSDYERELNRKAIFAANDE